MNTLSAMKVKIGPSILNADLANLASECNRLLVGGADYLHLDVMDGHFVPNLTFGHPVVQCLRKSIPKPTFFDMHMMVAQPEKWVDEMAKAGADMFTFHLEATEQPGALIRKIKEAGLRVGVGIKPNTPVDGVLNWADQVDMVLIMTVEPGFGGQKFMVEMMPKVKRIRSKFPHLDIEVDGGVGPSNIELCCQAGANMIVSGTAVVGSNDVRKTIHEMRETGQRVFHANCLV